MIGARSVWRTGAAVLFLLLSRTALVVESHAGSYDASTVPSLCLCCLDDDDELCCVTDDAPSGAWLSLLLLGEDNSNPPLEIIINPETMSDSESSGACTSDRLAPVKETYSVLC